MSEFLAKVSEVKKKELEEKKQHFSLSKLKEMISKQDEVLSFSTAILPRSTFHRGIDKDKFPPFLLDATNWAPLHLRPDQEGFSSFSLAIKEGKGIIAEIKRSSPSKGVFINEKEIESIAKTYERNGASALSVVTEEKYFQGNLTYLKKLKALVDLPILHKDFIIDEYQIWESKLHGADALLLIVALLEPKKLYDFIKLTEKVGMEALVEIHDKEELKIALEAEADIIGINNRNLKTLEVNPNTSLTLLPLIPADKIKIVESGLKSEQDIYFFKKLGADGFLIGEALLTAKNVGQTLRSFWAAVERAVKERQAR